MGLDAAVQGIVLVPGVDPLAILHFHEAVPGVVGAGVGLIGGLRLRDRRHVAAGVVGGLVPRAGPLRDAGDLVGVVDRAVLVEIVVKGILTLSLLQ